MFWCKGSLSLTAPNTWIHEMHVADPSRQRACRLQLRINITVQGCNSRGTPHQVYQLVWKSGCQRRRNEERHPLAEMIETAVGWTHPAQLVRSTRPWRSCSLRRRRRCRTQAIQRCFFRMSPRRPLRCLVMWDDVAVVTHMELWSRV